jgi:tetratricopeptide (TPR) repeat protein
MSRPKRKRRESTISPAHSNSPPTSREAEPFPLEVRSHNRWLYFAVCLLLALAVWAIFGQTLHYGFFSYDDNQWVYENSVTIQGLSLRGFFSAFTQVNCDEWYPLTVLSHMLDCQIYGLDPGGHHLTNVLLHGANAILLFLVLRKMTGAFWRSAFVTAVFAIHPLRVESVAWVTERKDVLSGLFFMLTLWAYTSHVRKQGGGGKHLFIFLYSPWYWLALFFFSLGLLAKSMLVTLPFLLMLLDYWPLQRLTLRSPRASFVRLIWEKIPLLLLAGFSCVPTILLAKGQIQAVRGISFPWRVGNALVAYADYLWQMICPVGLAVLYPHPGNHLSFWILGLSALLLLIISAGVVAGRRTHPYLLVGWLWYLGMLVPVIGFIQAGAQAKADRYTYLPQIGVYLMVAWGAAELCGRWRYRRTVLGSMAGAILVALLACAYIQTTYWKDSVTLWKHTLACTSNNSMAEGYLGLALVDQGDITDGIQYYEHALLLNPNNIHAQNNLGNALANQGKLTEAIQHYEQALQIEPDSAEAHYNLGIVLATQGNLAEAIQHYQRALQLKPDDPEALNRLGIASAMQGNFTEAVKCYEQALELKPDYFEALNSLGIALAKQGKMDEAVQQFKRALQIKPDDPETQNNLGVILATQGKLDEAIPCLQRALTLATARGNVALAEAIRARIKIYQPASAP